MVEEVTPAAAVAVFRQDVGALWPESEADGQRMEGAHHDWLQRWVQAEVAAAAQPARRRGPARQRAKRGLQMEIRQETLQCLQELCDAGHTLADAAELLGVVPRTLRHWQRVCRPEQLAIVPRGRPAARAPVGRRQEVLQFLQDEGAGVGVPTLRSHFPDLARAELSELVQRYRHVLAARYHTTAGQAHWRVPGRVWALDFAEPSRWGQAGVLPPIDGRYPYLLAVRDLASGYQLAWLPVPAASAAVTCAALAALFTQYGAPLVVKADNGAPFRAHQMQRFLEEAGVAILFSPPYWPGYNGAIEASIGSLKRRTEAHAVQQGRAGLWTSADVEAALVEANHSQPRRLHGRTPAESWASRTEVTAVERVRFELALERERFVARSELNLEQDALLDHWQASALDRKAIERALVGHDYLLFTRRCVPLTVQAGKVTFFV